MRKFLQIVEEIKLIELYKYIEFQNKLAYFYHELGSNKKSSQIRTKSLDFYEKSKQKNEIKKSWTAGQYGNLSWYDLLEKQPKKAIISAKKGFMTYRDLTVRV